MRKAIILTMFFLIASAVFGQEIENLNNLISLLNQPVPNNAQRLNRTEYSRLVEISDVHTIHEIFDTHDNKVIIVSEKTTGILQLMNRVFGEIFDILEPLGEPIVENKNSCIWHYKNHVILLLKAPDGNNLSSVY